MSTWCVARRHREQVNDLHAQVEGIVHTHGRPGREDGQLGPPQARLRDRRQKEGTYVLEALNASGEALKEIDRRLKVYDIVIRHLVVRWTRSRA